MSRPPSDSHEERKINKTLYLRIETCEYLESKGASDFIEDAVTAARIEDNRPKSEEELKLKALESGYVCSHDGTAVVPGIPCIVCGARSCCSPGTYKTISEMDSYFGKGKSAPKYYSGERYAQSEM